MRFGIGLSTLGKWVRAFSDDAKMPEQDADLLRENERSPKENRILRDLSRISKQSVGLFTGFYAADLTKLAAKIDGMV